MVDKARISRARRACCYAAALILKVHRIDGIYPRSDLPTNFSQQCFLVNDDLDAKFLATAMFDVSLKQKYNFWQNQNYTKIVP